MANSDSGSITKFPTSGLRHAKRFITSHNASGKGIFVADDDGNHHSIMLKGKAVANTIYSTVSNPVDLHNEMDIVWAHNNSHYHSPNGTIVRLIDFAPGVESPFHRTLSLDYGVVIEGVFELRLDSGESRLMYPGDVCVNRGAMHKWINKTPEGSGRILFVFLDCKPLFLEGTEIRQDLPTSIDEYPYLRKQQRRGRARVGGFE